jgi:nicotinamidase-related amidase
MPGPGRILVRVSRVRDRARDRTAARRAGHRQADERRLGSTDIDLVLRNRRIDHLIMTGITTDVCPHDHARGQRLGYEALLLSDCTGATDRTTTSARARW